MNEASRSYRVYILELENGNYYVGLTKGAASQRIGQHGGRHGAEWTRLHFPVGEVDVPIDTRTQDKEMAEAMENFVTWLVMQKYGWQRVRGGYFCHKDEEETRKNLLRHGFFEFPRIDWRGLTPGQALRKFGPR